MGYTCSVCDKYFEGNPRYFVCGKSFDTSPLDSKSICSDECYHKHFWTEALDNKLLLMVNVITSVLRILLLYLEVMVDVSLSFS